MTGLRTYLYVGCYTNSSSEAIRVLAVSAGGAVEQASAVETVEQASFLAAHPNGRVLYSVSETDSFGGEFSGALNAFAIDALDGSLELIGQVSSRGAGPCHLSVDAEGRHLFVANYLSGSFAAYELDPNGDFGALAGTHTNQGSGPSPRQEAPHAHCIVPGPISDGRTSHIYGVDLGIDTVTRFADLRAGSSDFEPAGSLKLTTGSGPRHITFNDRRALGLIACELTSTLVVAEVDAADGTLTAVEEYSTLPRDFRGESTVGEVRIHPNGRFVYVSNRGHNSIAVFELDQKAPVLEPRGWVDCGGNGPRHFAIDPQGTGLFVANEHSDTIVAFDVDVDTGGLRPRGATVPAVSPVCLMFLEVGS